jgi:hypothetical protein
MVMQMKNNMVPPLYSQTKENLKKSSYGLLIFLFTSVEEQVS